MAQVGEARPGYELWRPNREKAEAKTTKAIVSFVLLASAGLLAIITLGGWERLQSPGVGAITLGWAALYVAFAVLVVNWMRGVLPVAASLAVIMVIFAAVATPAWFARGKDGLSSPAMPEELLGLLTLIVIPVQLLLVAVAMIGFNQDWHVEEERPIDDREGGEPEPAAPAAVAEEEPPPAREEEPGEESAEQWRPPGPGPGPVSGAMETWNWEAPGQGAGEGDGTATLEPTDEPRVDAEQEAEHSKLPHLWASRPWPLRIALATIAPAAYGSLCGWVLGETEVGYIILGIAVAILLGFVVGLEHRNRREAAARGFVAGAFFGGFILIVNQLLIDTEPKFHIADPKWQLAIITAVFGAGLAALGVGLRRRLERPGR